MLDGAIFLSASVPDPERSPAYAESADTVAITAAVSALIFVTLGRRKIIWGGHPAITPMIWIMAQDIGVDYGRWVQLYQSRYFEDEFPADNTRFANVVYTTSVKGDRAKSLETMRSAMFSDNTFLAGVFIGGMEGIVDEYEMFRRSQPRALIVPVASTGGASIEVASRSHLASSELSSELDYVTLFHRHLGISVREERYRTPDMQPKAVSERFWRREKY